MTTINKNIEIDKRLMLRHLDQLMKNQRLVFNKWPP